MRKRLKWKGNACLGRKHWAKECKTFSKCPLCSKKHDILMCPELHNNQCRKETGPGNLDVHVRDVKMNFSERSTVYLGTFRVKQWKSNAPGQSFIGFRCTKIVYYKQCCNKIRIVSSWRRKIEPHIIRRCVHWSKISKILHRYLFKYYWSLNEPQPLRIRRNM